MKCSQCGTETTGNFCPKCGTALPQKKAGKLLGFRSHRLWKMFLSVCYLIFCGFCLLGVVFTTPQGQISTYDFIISQTSSIVLLFIFFSPYIFLSNTKFRNWLPLFKKHTFFSSMLGMIITICLLFILFGCVNSLHSAEYKADMKSHAYVQVSHETATCEKSGYTEYVCDYCAKTKTDTIPAIGHNFAEISNESATCETAGKVVKECLNCGTKESENIPATGHTMEEVERKESTTSTTGYIIKTCRTCNKQETIELPRIVPETTAPTTTPTTAPTIAPTTVPTPTVSPRDAYINSCTEGNYEEIARYPEKHKGEQVYFKGHIMSVSESIWGNSVTYLIQVTQGSYGIWEDIVYVTYTRSADAPKILEDDIVTFYGKCMGDYTYLTVLGSTNTVPYVDAKYIDIH